MDIYFYVVIFLILVAAVDLMVGVSNDAVNFLNSSIGSLVAPRYVIMIVASLGILVGVTFSGGMMEVARKGIFHPKFFTMPELMAVFAAVMITDILLLDLYNTFGLPTSTTVSIVFELLGAAVALSIIKTINAGSGFSEMGKYINSGKALIIISGILLSIVIAFFFGALVQYITRIIFTFDYRKRLKRYGALWGGLAISIIIYFILIKGAKGSTFMTPEMVKLINLNKWIIMGGIFLATVIIFQLFLIFTNIDILKPVVLIGTFALAMAFAANDLVNFIGVPLAGLESYKTAALSADPLNQTMSALHKKVHTDTLYLLIAGVIMVITLWLSRKARTVTETEVSLGRQEEGFERFESLPLSRTIVRMVYSLSDLIGKFVPETVKVKITSRFDYDKYTSIKGPGGETQSFDLLRASVNLVVASAVISFATSMKLPLSTTYVTFMVAMGASLSDRAWGRESAVYRVTGVLMVIGGWFFTALSAFTVSMFFAFIIYYLQGYGILLLICLAVFVIWSNHHQHNRKVQEKKELDVFTLKKIKDVNYAIVTSFNHCGIFLKEVNSGINQCSQGLFLQNRNVLKDARRNTKKVQNWANIVIANIFKTLRLLERRKVRHLREYIQIINWLQGIAESQRDMIIRSYVHVDNNHKGLLDIQVSELSELKDCISSILEKTYLALQNAEVTDKKLIDEYQKKMNDLEMKFNENQISRIIDLRSKTRLSILYYGYMENLTKIGENSLNLLKLSGDLFKIDFNKVD